MRKLTRWSVAALLVALGVPSPAYAAPGDDPSDVVKALRLQATLKQQLTGEKSQVSVTDVTDGFPGGSPIAAGDDATCFAGDTKTWCWGGGSPDPSRAAVSFVPGAVAAGRAHSCALEWFEDGDDGGDLYCWGDNAEGQVGDGTTTTRTEPVQVGTSIRQVAAGNDHTCAITDNQSVECWGKNDVGQLGIGTSGASETTPQAVSGLPDVIDLAAGGDTTCAVDEDGMVWCWGSDADGQVGDGTANTGSSATPVQIASTDTFQQVEVGDGHACAVNEDYELWCWGSDAHGELGDDDAIADKDEPVEVDLPASADIMTASAGGDSTCAVTDEGLAQCWGDNSEGQLGTGDRTDQSTPVEVDQSAIRASAYLAMFGIRGNQISSISVGDRHACALDVQDNAYCWGDNAAGQLGDGTTDDHLIPEATELVPGVPTGMSAQPGNEQLSVTWTAPSDFGVGTLLMYGVLAISDEGLGDCTTRTTGCRVTGLTNGLEYSVMAATITDGGMAFGAVVPGIPIGLASRAPAPVAGEGGGQGSDQGGGQLPITGAAVSLLILIGGTLVAGGLILRRRAA